MCELDTFGIARPDGVCSGMWTHYTISKKLWFAIAVAMDKGYRGLHLAGDKLRVSLVSRRLPSVMAWSRRALRCALRRPASGAEVTTRLYV
jgi:hypothetical protein